MEYRIRVGASTLYLTSDGTVMTRPQYTPQVGAYDADEVRETLTLAMEGAVADMANLKSLYQRYLYQAAVYADRKAGDRVFLEGRVNSSSAWEETELLSGETSWVTPRMVKDGQAELAISWVRKNYWLDPEAQAPLTNGNGTNNTSGLTVWSHDDAGAGHDNYVQIDASAIGGDLPAPVRIELTNTYNDSDRLNYVWVAHNAYSDPANFQHIIEGEASAVGSAVADASCSGGYRQTLSWAGTTGTAGRWTLDSTFLSRTRGQWFKVFARVSGLTPGYYRVQCKLMFPASTPLTDVATSQEVLLSDRHLQEIGTLQLPPWLPGETNLAPIALVLQARRADGVAGGSFNLDYLHIIPLDGYRLLKPKGYGAAYNIRLALDEINGNVWTDGWAGAGKTGHYTVFGVPIGLVPGRVQRLYFLQDEATGFAPIERTMSVKVFYRTKRLSL